MQEFLQLQGDMNHFLQITACISHESPAAFLTFGEKKEKEKEKKRKVASKGWAL